MVFPNMTVKGIHHCQVILSRGSSCRSCYAVLPLYIMIRETLLDAKRTCSARWRSFSASSMRSRVDFLSVGALNCCASCSASTWACMHQSPLMTLHWLPQCLCSFLVTQGRWP